VTDSSAIEMERPNCPYSSSPFIIYAGSKGPEHVSAGLKKGVLGVTNDPHKTTLLKMLFVQENKKSCNSKEGVKILMVTTISEIFL
jgi:hypothetical protein